MLQKRLAHPDLTKKLDNFSRILLQIEHYSQMIFNPKRCFQLSRTINCLWEGVPTLRCRMKLPTTTHNNKQRICLQQVLNTTITKLYCLSNIQIHFTFSHQNHHESYFAISFDEQLTQMRSIVVLPSLRHV